MLKIFVDGGLRNDTIHIGVFSNSPKLDIKFNKRICIGTSHTAEELALYSALRILEYLKVNEDVIILTDHIGLVSLINKKIVPNHALINYPKLNQMRTILLLNPNIKVVWVKKRNNPAHALVVNAYIDKFSNTFIYNPSISISELDSINEIESLINRIKSLEDAIIKKDLVIDNLLKTIKKLNK